MTMIIMTTTTSSLSVPSKKYAVTDGDGHYDENNVVSFGSLQEIHIDRTALVSVTKTTSSLLAPCNPLF